MRSGCEIRRICQFLVILFIPRPIDSASPNLRRRRRHIFGTKRDKTMKRSGAINDAVDARRRVDITAD